jgi:hypothetical protein
MPYHPVLILCGAVPLNQPHMAGQMYDLDFDIFLSNITGTVQAVEAKIASTPLPGTEEAQQPDAEAGELDEPGTKGKGKSGGGRRGGSARKKAKR